MTEEDKKLLLADICSRLLYGIIVRCDKYKNLPNVPCFEYKRKGMFKLYVDELPIEVEFIKPYLRPMSSITKDERNEYFDFRSQELQRVAFAEMGREEAISEVMDWLLSHHFDYRGLIEKELALEAPKDMYNIKEK